MAAQDVAAAWRRVEAVLVRRPETGLHDDSPATARWDGGTRVIARHANGKQVATDMAVELGGSGDQVTPGWLLRAGFAACTATTIAMVAAARDIELDTLEVKAVSRSDLRGMFDLAQADGSPVDAGPRDMRLQVRIAARAVSEARLRELVEDGYRCSPMACAVLDAVPVDLQIETRVETDNE